MKKKIAIAMGGYSNEYKISLNSGNLVYKHLNRKLYEPYRVHILKEGWFVLTEDEKKYSINKADFSAEINGEQVNFDVVFNIIHGTPGEDGLLQGYLKLIGMPQTACDYYQAALTFNKRDCISILRAFDVKTAENYFLNKGDDYSVETILQRVGLPCFVKANKSGSSFGISKVKEARKLPDAIQFSFEEDEEVIIESFLEGIEVSVGVVHYQGQVKALPVTEIVSENEFFDYEAKYLGQSKEITPARISPSQTSKVQAEAERIFSILKLKGLVRAEFIFHKGEPHFIEINTCPGLSEASIVPQQIKSAGISLQDLFGDLIETALKKNE